MYFSLCLKALYEPGLVAGRDLQHPQAHSGFSFFLDGMLCR